MPHDPHTHSPGAPSTRSRPRRVLSLTSRRETTRVARILRAELVGGILLIVMAAIGFAAANSPLSPAYEALRDFKIGPEALHLNLSLGTWAADGLLAIFFFLTGLELKREFVAGELSRFRTAIVPVTAAFGGAVVPALLFVAFTAGSPEMHGWSIPTATDIAFAVTVLGLIAPGVPPALRMFLLTLAVVDDLIAISVIAVFYSSGIDFLMLGLAVIPFAAFAFLAHRFPAKFAASGWAPWLILLPIGVVVWALVHASGIHATIAGVALAFAIPVEGRGGTALAETFEHRFRPLSSGFAVPVFAFFAAGVAISGTSGFPFSPVALGIIVGLVVGKPLGIALTTWILTKWTRAELDPAIRWRELIGVAALAGIGFTVSLLVTELSFDHPETADLARLAVMAASLLAPVVAACFLVRPKRRATAVQP